MHCNNSVGHHHCFQYPTCWPIKQETIKQENHEGKRHVIAYIKNKTKQNITRLKILMLTRWCQFKIKYWRVQLFGINLSVYIFTEANHIQLIVSMCWRNIGNPPVEDSSWRLHRNIHVHGMQKVVNILHIYRFDRNFKLSRTSN